MTSYKCVGKKTHKKRDGYIIPHFYDFLRHYVKHHSLSTLNIVQIQDGRTDKRLSYKVATRSIRFLRYKGMTIGLFENIQIMI